MRHDDVTRGSDLLAAAVRLPDGELLSAVGDLASRSRRITVELLAHLAEVDRRRLYCGLGCGRLFTYCTEVLRLSEAAAWNRVKAVRAARRFPEVLEMLADGRINLTTIRLLEPHLTAANHRELLAETSGMTRREIDKVVARLSPRPDVRSSITALAPERYGLRVTLGEEAHRDLRWLQDAMRREVPDGDPSEIVTRALRAFRRAVERKTFGATDRPHASRGVMPGSREIPAAVQRAVWIRDGGRCAFVARNGRRCTERSYLEFHHQEPYGIGGEPTVANIALRCRAHNAYESEQVFGPLEPARRRGAEARANAIGPGTHRRVPAAPPPG